MTEPTWTGFVDCFGEQFLGDKRPFRHTISAIAKELKCSRNVLHYFYNHCKQYFEDQVEKNDENTLVFTTSAKYMFKFLLLFKKNVIDEYKLLTMPIALENKEFQRRLLKIKKTCHFPKSFYIDSLLCQVDEW